MATLKAPARPSAQDRPAVSARASLIDAATAVGTAISLLGLAVLAVLLPSVLHPLLDAAGSPMLLGVTAAEAHRLSDLTVQELLVGPGTFAVVGPDGAPLYDASEAAHLRDARAVLFGFLGFGAIAAALIAARLLRGSRAVAWRWISRGGAGLVLVVLLAGAVALIAFEPAFELFHRVFFPGGNWAFDPGTQRLVQLYPLAFWQYVSALVGLVAVLLGSATWWLAGRRARPSRDGRATA